jgi:enoyl-CoA hydratase
MDSPFITAERSDSHLIIRLNHPENFNALSREMILTLGDSFTSLDSQPKLRAVILTGTGDKAFCAGMDTAELTGDSEHDLSKLVQGLFSQIESSHVPVIAAVNGIAVGDGCKLALACHLIIASDNAQFSLPETRSGVDSGSAGTRRLACEFGEEGVLELLSGKPVSAEEALRFGFINRVVPAAELVARAEDLASEIAQLAPLAIRACLEAVIKGNQLPLAEGLALEAKLFASLFDTNDVQEGTSAFLEKRVPVFKGT